MNPIPPLTAEELETAYQLRADTGLSMPEIWLKINNNREPGKWITLQPLTTQLNRYIMTRHTILSTVPLQMVNEAFTRDLDPLAWSNVKQTIQDNSLTVGDVDYHEGNLYIKGTVMEVIDTNYGYLSEQVIKKLA